MTFETIRSRKAPWAALGIVACAAAAGLFTYSGPAGAAPNTAPKAPAETPVVSLPMPGSDAPSATPHSSSFDFNAGNLPGGATGRWCFQYGNYKNVGPVAVSAAATVSNVVLVTESTDLENRRDVGWAYCATVRNASSLGTDVTLMTRASL